MMISRLQAGVLLIIVAARFLPVTAQINLALHGTVAQETTYTLSGSDSSYDATVAIEGPANNNWEDGCSSTGYQAKTWWGLFLPRLAYITNVKAYYRKDEAHRMNDFRLYFANGSVYHKTELCFRDTGKQAQSNLNQSIDCNLSPTRNIYYFNRNTFVELCYIEINGCWKGFWGENCTVPCPHNCIDQHCHPANGSCIWGCDPSKCLQGCFVSTGICSGGCVLGQAGQYCNKYNLAYNQTANIFPLASIFQFLISDLVGPPMSYYVNENPQSKDG
ncbi:Hypothetical predicted protein [Mytilus galloprovincialis]|uniref:Fucolectin tachylectin-4 pentraxin-1 domain-containing protein n=1 Tax=Mytilus galloprovincialis TaxID=29158 RepID=A0A8B6G030_MYTGA|nr:Hypothetical predicted protein [Mytilus galloprovincialis]